MGQILKLIEPYPLKKWGHNSANTIHAMTEAMQLAYADRSEWLAIATLLRYQQRLLHPTYIRERRKRIRLKHNATPYPTI